MATMTMTERNMFVGMLRQGRTGDQVLQILDVIAGGDFNTAQAADEVVENTAEVLPADEVLF